jgi:hypothetical protein
MVSKKNIAPRPILPAHLCDPLRERGFMQAGCVHRKEGLTLAASGRWYVLSEGANEPQEGALSRGMSQPGLWKWARDGAAPQRVFEIPCWAVSDQPEDDRLDTSGPAPFAKLLDWALETRFGRVPPGWLRPDPDLVASWVPHGALTVQAKGYVRQGELILDSARWALRIPIQPRLAEDLPEPRCHALEEELVGEAQRLWAMARIGVPADTSPAALVAEVDFTGAPHSESLFSAGLDVLRHVVASLVETADVLADPSVAIACLAPGANNTNTKKEKTT